MREPAGVPWHASSATLKSTPVCKWPASRASASEPSHASVPTHACISSLTQYALGVRPSVSICSVRAMQRGASPPDRAAASAAPSAPRGEAGMHAVRWSRAATVGGRASSGAPRVASRRAAPPPRWPPIHASLPAHRRTPPCPSPKQPLLSRPPTPSSP
eukprot:3437438-Prymnesium_polylepis.1